jgi:acetolactate synthase-1/2/3 large subunit
MPTCAEVLARTLRDAGIRRMFGLPGGEVLDFLEASRRAGIDFVLTRHEATASFMADVSGQIQRRPGVCVSTLGPGAVNMTLGVANAWLDRSPLIAITGAHARAAEPYATHQKLDLLAVYRPFTKLALTLDGVDTEGKVRRAIRESLTPRPGPVHIALPSDVARAPDRETGEFASEAIEPDPTPPAPEDAIEAVALEIARARRPVLLLGLDLEPRLQPAVRDLAEALGAPVFVTPKAKGMLPEDHPLFHGVCAGVAGDAVIVEFLGRADLLVGLGFEPVESDKLWHQTMKLVAVNPTTIAAGAYRPHREAVGDLAHSLAALRRRKLGPFAWTGEERRRLAEDLLRALRPAAPPAGLSPYELTRRLRELFPRDTVFVTDVGSVKAVTTQAWTTYEPGTFFESNGLSAMSYSMPAAMAARLQFPERPVLCAVGDGGFGMTFAELETCVRERIHFVTVVYDDRGLSQIAAAQRRKGYPSHGVQYGAVDFAAVSAALGAWARRVSTMDELDAAVREALAVDRPAVIDAVVDPAEYDLQQGPSRPAPAVSDAAP